MILREDLEEVLVIPLGVLADLVQVLVRRLCGDLFEILLQRSLYVKILKMLCIDACMKVLLGC